MCHDPHPDAGADGRLHTGQKQRPRRRLQPRQPVRQWPDHRRGQHCRHLTDPHCAHRLRVGHDLGGGAFADDLPPLDHRHPVGQKLRLVHVMRDQHHRHPQMRAQGDDLGMELFARGPVHRRKGFVQQQGLRTAGQRTGNRNPLLLTARQLRGPSVRQAVQIDEIQKTLRPLAVWRIHRRHHILRRRHMRKKRVILEHNSNPALMRGQVDPARRIKPCPPLHPHPPRLWPPEPRNGPQNRGFSRTRMTHQRQQLPRFNAEGDIQRDGRTGPCHDFQRHQPSLRPTRDDSQKVTAMVISEIATRTADMVAAARSSKPCTLS